MTCDESLYRQYLSGDDEGLNALMKKYGDPLTLYIDGYLHDVHEAEELMLDVFAYLFTKKPKILDGGFKAYLYKAARNMALRHKSKRKPLFSLDALADEPDGRLLAEEVIRSEERNRILHFCMDEMNPDYREVLYLTYFEDMSYAQAHKCGVMRSALRRPSGASPKWSERNGCGAIRSPWLPLWRRALRCSSVHPSPCPILPQASRPATIPALKRRPASFTAALPWDTSSSGCWLFCSACA